MATAPQAEQWKTSGVLKTPGIPTPSGEYSVGCVDLMEETGLLVRLFYPTAADEQSGEFQYAKATPDPKYAVAFCQIRKKRPVWLMSSIINKLTDPRSPALQGAPLYNHPAPRQVQGTAQATQAEETPVIFPVVVFSHGLTGHRCSYSGICCDIASHGYVVAAVEHKDESAGLTFNRIPGPGVAEGEYDKYINEWVPYLVRPIEDFQLRNQQLQQRQSEVSKALDILQSLNEGTEVKNLMGGTFDPVTQFTGRLDTNRAAVMGHSYGGGTTVKTLAADSRFKCGIALDTWMFPVDSDVYDTGINQPLLFINSYTFQWAKNVASIMKLVTPPDEAGISKCSIITLIGTNHYTQTDRGFVLPPIMAKEFYSENAYEANVVNSELTTAFLKRYLLKDPSYQGRVPLLDGGEGSSELVLYGTNVDWNEGKDQEENQENGGAKGKRESKGEGSEEVTEAGREEKEAKHLEKRHENCEVTLEDKQGESEGEGLDEVTKTGRREDGSLQQPDETNISEQ